jgi:hypothetical protein
VTISLQTRADTPVVEVTGNNAALLLRPAVMLSYVLLVLCMWIPFGPSNGMPYETGFVYQSATSSWWDAFFYSDPLRQFTNVFYQLSYLLGSAVTFPGDYLMYQLVYAALWWARGLLAFMIVRRLLGGHEVFAYLVGAVVIVHASDGALNWVGQLNQFGFIFWMLLSAYCLLSAFDGARGEERVLHTGLACFFAYLSLWSYESQIVLIAIFPLTFFAFYRRLTRSRVAMIAAYWTVPAAYAMLNYVRYSKQSLTYQQSVIRRDFSPSTLFSDLMFNVRASLEFWTWPRTTLFEGSGLVPAEMVMIGVVVLVGGYVVVRRLAPSCASSARIGMPPVRTLAALLCVGALLLVCSFPVYLLLDSSRGLWRTQFLSGFGAAVVLCSLAALPSAWLRRARWHEILPVFVVALVTGFGVWEAYQAGWIHHRNWERHRVALEEVLRNAPSVKPDTLIVLVDIPASIDPFGDNMWFDMGVRLAYPGVSVAGAYYRDDATRPPGNGLVLFENRWVWNGMGYPPLMRSIPFEHTIIIRYDARGHGMMLDEVPAFLTTDPAVKAEYSPHTLVAGVHPAPTAARRFIRDSGPASQVDDGS